MNMGARGHGGLLPYGRRLACVSSLCDLPGRAWLVFKKKEHLTEALKFHACLQQNIVDATHVYIYTHTNTFLLHIHLYVCRYECMYVCVYEFTHEFNYTNVASIFTKCYAFATCCMTIPQKKMAIAFRWGMLLVGWPSFEELIVFDGEVANIAVGYQKASMV